MTKTIVKDEILFTHKLDTGRGFQLTLNKQDYSDGTCFYTLTDQWGISKVERSHDNLQDMIEQMEHEKNVSLEFANKDYNKDNEIYLETHRKVIDWLDRIINTMKELTLQTV